jgi:hypothetical protein
MRQLFILHKLPSGYIMTSVPLNVSPKVNLLYLIKKSKTQPDMVVHNYNHSYARGRDGRIVVGGNLGIKMLTRFSLKNKLGMVVHICNLSYLGGRGRRIKVLGQPY